MRTKPEESVAMAGTAGDPIHPPTYLGPLYRLV